MTSLMNLKCFLVTKVPLFHTHTHTHTTAHYKPRHLSLVSKNSQLSSSPHRQVSDVLKFPLNLTAFSPHPSLVPSSQCHWHSQQPPLRSFHLNCNFTQTKPHVLSANHNIIFHPAFLDPGSPFGSDSNYHHRPGCWAIFPFGAGMWTWKLWSSDALTGDFVMSGRCDAKQVCEKEAVVGCDEL